MNREGALDWIFSKTNTELSRETGIPSATCAHCKWEYRSGILSEKRGDRFLNHYFKKTENVKYMPK